MVSIFMEVIMSMETKITLVDVVKLERQDVVLNNQKYLNDGYNIITCGNSSLKEIIVPENSIFFEDHGEVVRLIVDAYNSKSYSSFEDNIIHDLQIISLCNPNIVFSVQFEYPEYEADLIYRLHILNGKMLVNKAKLKFQYENDDEIVQHIDMIS